MKDITTRWCGANTPADAVVVTIVESLKVNKAKARRRSARSSPCGASLTRSCQRFSPNDDQA